MCPIQTLARGGRRIAPRVISPGPKDPLNQTFHSFPLAPAVLQGLEALGFTTPTPVQAAATPLLLGHRDAIVQAKTGSGKTLAFGLPLLTMIQPAKKPQALVVLPTRELAMQVCEAIASVQGPKGAVRVLAVYGGVGYQHQETALKRGVDLVVGTPGRLKDLLDRKTLDLSQVRILVLDEADQMLDMGFRRDIDFLLARLPKREQTLIFSATMPSEIEAIARQHLTNPEIVKLIQPSEATPVEIDHGFVRVPASRRLDALVTLLGEDDPERALVFTRMKHETKKLAAKLNKHTGWAIGYLNGNMSQNARNTALAGFKSGELRMLVATDVAARGLDVEGLSHVYHYAVPDVVETYIHRSGRTGRNGASGSTMTLVTPDDEEAFKAIRRRIQFSERSIALPTQELGELEQGQPTRGGRQGDRRQGARPPRRDEASAAQPNRPTPRPASEAKRPAAKPAKEGTPRAGSRAAAAAPERKTFRLPLHAGHGMNRGSLSRWLIAQTQVPPAALGSITVAADHALIQVDVRHAEAFKQELRRRQGR